MNTIMECLKNEKWNSISNPKISVITPVYNREDTVIRAMQSIANQTFRDFEYIVVDDGSTDKSSEIIKEYLKSNIIPMMYIKKPNGGVHTARNLGIRYARGEMYLCNDSDDETLPDGLEKFITAWLSIPNDMRKEYFEIKGRCIDQNGKEVGQQFPADINTWPWAKVKKYYENHPAEHVGFRVMSIMKENPWPEPAGITFVGEDFLWKKLRRQYKTWLINDIVQIYHTEGNDHLEGTLNTKKIRTLQSCINTYWKASYTLNHFEVYGNNKRPLKCIFSRVLMFNVLNAKRADFEAVALHDNKQKMIEIILFPIGYFAAQFYIKKYNL